MSYLSDKIERWRPVPVPEFGEYYAISDMGRVRSLPRTSRRRRYRGKILRPVKMSSGYLYISMRVRGKGLNKLCRIHRLVAEAFLPNPDNLPVVNHKNEDKTDNRASNLEWCSVGYNANYGHGALTRNDMNRLRCNKRVAMYRGNSKVCEFESSVEAESCIGIRAGNIRQCCRGVTKSAGGYTWRYSFN